MNHIKRWQNISNITMDKSSILKAYNKLFFDFMDDMITVYPTKEIKYAKEQFEFIKKANPTIIIKCWKKDIYDKYHDQIEQKDITFFIEKDYRADLIIDEQTTRKVLDIIETIRSTIRDMDEKNREHCAEYIINLSKLSLIYDNLTK